MILGGHNKHAASGGIIQIGVISFETLLSRDGKNPQDLVFELEIHAINSSWKIRKRYHRSARDG